MNIGEVRRGLLRLWEFLKKPFGGSSNPAKKQFVALIGTLTNDTITTLCPQVDFEAGVLELAKLPRELMCGGCGKTFTLPSGAFLVKQDLLGKLDFIHFGFRTNAVGSLTGVADTYQPQLLILTACGALSIIESMRRGQATTWGCLECQTADNAFPAGWPGEDSALGVVKKALLASTGANDFVRRLQGEGFLMEKKTENEGIITTVLGQRGFIVLVSVVPRMGADKIIELSAGDKGGHGFKLIERGERKFRIGGVSQDDNAEVVAIPPVGRSEGSTSAHPKSDYWKCPKCGRVLRKGVGAVFAATIGTATCGGCGAKFSQSDVYGGQYDVLVDPLCDLKPLARASTTPEAATGSQGGITIPNRPHPPANARPAIPKPHSGPKQPAPQISCPKCRASMIYTAAKCPRCGNRMVKS